MNACQLTIILEIRFNNLWNSSILSSFRSLRKTVDQEEVDGSQCSMTDPLGLNAILNNLMKLTLKGTLFTQVSCQNAVLIPKPSLKTAKSSTSNQDFEMLIHGLRRLRLAFPKVCQLNMSLPWILFTTWLRREFVSFNRCQPHLANRARFLASTKAKPSILLGLSN